MKFVNLAFILTDDCNFNCSYCQRKKEKKYMTSSTIEKAVTFFYPFLREEAYIVFFGGEPLLAFASIKYAVSLFQEKNRENQKKLVFSLTTNGSLITGEILHFLNLHRISMMLSFDGEVQDISRKTGSLVPTRELIDRLQSGSYPGIGFSINSVFTPENVNHLSTSLQDIIESGVTKLQLSFAKDQPWDEAALMCLEKELERLTGFLVSYYREKGVIPVTNFRPSMPPSKSSPKSKEIFYCDGGYRRMAITPEGNLLGCLVFHGYLKDRRESDEFRTYSFGTLDDFSKNHAIIYPRVLSNYAMLRQDCFFTEDQFCFLCEELEFCGHCPANLAYATSLIGRIPPWMCRFDRIQRKVKKKFLEEINA